MTLGYTITHRGIDLERVEIPEDLRRRIAQHFDDQLMRLAFGGPAPTTLYVDKRGNLSTVDPNAKSRHFNRWGFTFEVSS
jgi:hypothetical protein